MKIFLLLSIYMISLYALSDTYNGLIDKDKITIERDSTKLNEKGVTSSDRLSNDSLRVYGVGLQINVTNKDTEDKSYSGFGMQFENDFSNIVLEYGSDYKKGSAVIKGDITNYFYIKGGLGYLQRGMFIEDSDTDVTQHTGGSSLGYGDEKSYNIEAGHITSQLENASLADGYSKISYLELIAKHSFAKYATFDIVGIYKNSNVFDKNYADYQAELGWFASDNVRTYLAYNSVEHSKNDYAVRFGAQYTFATSKFSPYLKASFNPDENIASGVEYSQGISNKSLKMRDLFENTIGSNTIVAQAVAPSVFATKVAKEIPTVNTTNSTVNHASTGQNSTTLFVGTTGTFDLASLINDSDGDSMTINITRTYNDTGYHASFSLIGTTITVELNHRPVGFYKIYYTVSDGKATSSEYRLTLYP